MSPPYIPFILIFSPMNFIIPISEYFKSVKILQHILFWLVILLIGIPRYLIEENFPFYVWIISNICILIPQVIFSYYLAYFVIPNFFFKKEYIYAFIWLIVGTYILSVLGRVLVIYIIETLPNNQAPDQESLFEIMTDWKYLIRRYIPSLYSISFVFLFIKFFLDYDRTLNKSLQLNKEKVEAELKTLKAQLNPHFLFNTLNNIYSLSVCNSPKTSTSIGKLSEILDYVLYRCNTKFVLLSNEIKLLKNYIELEKLRYDDRLETTFTNHMENDTEIPPLILLSLVENAFKHGAGEDRGSPKIDIEVSNTKELFVFRISNTVSSDYEHQNKGSIGLPNIKKQLDLIYNEAYNLSIENLENSFVVLLEINQK